MENLKESDIKAWLKREVKNDKLPVYFKKLTCTKTYSLAQKVKIADIEINKIEAGKTYILWICPLENKCLAVFFPETDSFLTVPYDTFGDWQNATDAARVSCGKETYVLISDWKGERLLVPSWRLYPEEVEKRFPEAEKFSFWRPEFVFDSGEWFTGVAFYQHLSASAYPDKRFRWQAFYRIDTGEWLEKYDRLKYGDKMKVLLSEAPVEIGNFKIQFFTPVINFCFI